MFVIDDKVMDCNIVIPNEAKDCLSLPNYEIDQLRSSIDTKTNNYGKCLINFCQNIDVRIVNGRFGVYSSLATCRDASVVDYFIISPELFNSVISMKVRNFDPLFSDVHNVIELHIHPSFIHSVNNELVIHDDITVNDENVIPFKYCWSQEKAEDYVCNIDRIKMSELVLELDKCLANHEYVNDVQIDTLNKNLCDLFSDAAANSDMVKLCGQHKNRNMHDKGKAKKQKWFDSNCKISRKAYHKAKHNYNVCKSSNNKELLRLSSKKFSQLNKDKNVHDVSEVDRASDHTVFENAYLNGPFSEDEVMAVLSQLKCGKAAGPDLLINEFFKYSRTTTCSLLTKMFNVVLLTGALPGMGVHRYVFGHSLVYIIKVLFIFPLLCKYVYCCFTLCFPHKCPFHHYNCLIMYMY